MDLSRMNETQLQNVLIFRQADRDTIAQEALNDLTAMDGQIKKIGFEKARRTARQNIDLANKDTDIEAVNEAITALKTK